MQARPGKRLLYTVDPMNHKECHIRKFRVYQDRERFNMGEWDVQRFLVRKYISAYSLVVKKAQGRVKRNQWFLLYNLLYVIVYVDNYCYKCEDNI